MTEAERLHTDGRHCAPLRTYPPLRRNPRVEAFLNDLAEELSREVGRPIPVEEVARYLKTHPRRLRRRKKP
jgi:hypothetical protein